MAPMLENPPRIIDVKSKKGRPTVVMADPCCQEGEPVFRRTRDWRTVLDAVPRVPTAGAPALRAAGAAAVMLRAWEWLGEHEGDRKTLAARLSFILALKETAREAHEVPFGAGDVGWGADRALESVSEALSEGKGPKGVAKRLKKLAKALVAEDGR